MVCIRICVKLSGILIPFVQEINGKGLRYFEDFPKECQFLLPVVSHTITPWHLHTIKLSNLYTITLSHYPTSFTHPLPDEDITNYGPQKKTITLQHYHNTTLSHWQTIILKLSLCHTPSHPPMLTHPLPYEDIMYDCPATENNPQPNHHGGHDCRRLVEMEESEENDSWKYHMHMLQVKSAVCLQNLCLAEILCITLLF